MLYDSIAFFLIYPAVLERTYKELLILCSIVNMFIDFGIKKMKELDSQSFFDFVWSSGFV